MTILIALIISVTIALPVTYIIIHLHDAKDRKLIFGDKLEYNQDDSPLLGTIEAMEHELAMLNENNVHMRRIAQLEKDIEEAKKHAEALSQVAGNYGSTMEEVGESIVGSVGGRSAIHTVVPVDSNGIVVGGTLSKGLDADTKSDWKGYVNSLRHNLDLMGDSVLPDSITEGMSLSEYKKLYDFIYEHKALDIGRQFNNKATCSVKTLVSHLSLEDFRNPEAYANEAYDLLLRGKQSYEVYAKVFEEEVFDLGVFRDVILTYFEKKDTYTSSFGKMIQELEKDEFTRKEDWFKKEQDKIIREIEEQLREADKSIRKAEYGKWNTIPKKLSHEERVSTTRQNTAHFRTYTSQSGWSSYYGVTFK